VGKDAPDVPDAAYIVQMQFQMHAVGVDRGFLGIWTPLHGLTIFHVPYNRTFMQFASQVMKLVAEKYLLPESPDLPTCTIHEESQLIQRAWGSMMHALQDTRQSVTRLIKNGEPPVNAFHILMYTYM
jgi:hypothetical protein